MTTRRTLTITLQPDRRAALRQEGKSAQADRYQGETLNFESPGAFFGRLTERRWALVTALLGQGAMAIRELARRVGRDVKRVHEDVQILAEPGLLERDEAGGVVCPYADVRIDMHVHHARATASRREHTGAPQSKCAHAAPEHLRTLNRWPDRPQRARSWPAIVPA